MWWRLLLAVFLGRSALAAWAPSPLRWGGKAAQRYVISSAPLPSSHDDGIESLPLKLSISDKPIGRTSPNALPKFTVKSDNSIGWDAKRLCIEASGPTSGAAVNLNRCNGGPAQRWNWLYRRIQLLGSNQCLDVDDTDGALNGAAIRLRECDNQVTQRWELESGSPARQGLAQSLLSSFSIRHSMMSFTMLAALLSLGVPVSRMLQKSPAVLNQVPTTVDNGGVCLTSCVERLPVVMAVSPEQIDTDGPTQRTDEENEKKKDPLIKAEIDNDPPAVLTMPVTGSAVALNRNPDLGLADSQPLALEKHKSFAEWFLLPTGLMVSLIVRTFALKTLSADPSVNIVLSLRTFEELVTSFFGAKASDSSDKQQGVAEADVPSGEGVAATAVKPLPEWFAWDLTQLAALLRVVNGVATVKALEVAPMPVFGVVCSMEPLIAFLILLGFDRLVGRGTHHEARDGGRMRMGMQEIGLFMLVVGAALAKFGDMTTEHYVYWLCALKAVLSAGEDTMQDEARIETGLESQVYVPALYKRVLPMSVIAALYFEILPAFQSGQTLIPSSPSALTLGLVFTLPILGYVAEWLWFELNRVTGDPVITMSMQPPKDALASFLIPGSFDHLGDVAMFGYTMNLLGVGVYASNSARGKERREEAETDSEVAS